MRVRTLRDRYFYLTGQYGRMSGFLNVAGEIARRKIRAKLADEAARAFAAATKKIMSESRNVYFATGNSPSGAEVGLGQLDRASEEELSNFRRFCDSDLYGKVRRFKEFGK